MRSGLDVDACLSFLGSLASSGPVLLLLARAQQPATGDHVLGLPMRRAIYETVLAKPGITLGELRSRVKVGWGTGYHHLRRLERAGLIVTLRMGRRSVIWPVGPAMDVVREEDAQARALLLGKTIRRVCADIAAHPATEVSDTAARIGQTKRVVYYHVQQLAAHGLVMSSSRTRQFALHVTPRYYALMVVPEK